MRILSAILLALVMAAAPLTTSASYGLYHWSKTYGGWIDDDCNANSKFVVVLFQDGPGSNKVKVCSDEYYFNIVPMGGSNANDRVTHIRVVRWWASNCQLYFFRDAEYRLWRQWVRGIGDYKAHYNDEYSSMQLQCWI